MSRVESLATLRVHLNQEGLYEAEVSFSSGGFGKWKHDDMAEAIRSATTLACDDQRVLDRFAEDTLEMLKGREPRTLAYIRSKIYAYEQSLKPVPQENPSVRHLSVPHVAGSCP